MGNESVMTQRGKRNSAIELCRILSMLMIVGCHFATHGGFDFSASEITVPRLWWHVIEMGGNHGVDVFVLITGYFLIGNTALKINPRKALRLWGQIFFYSVVLFVFGVAIGIEQFSLLQLANALIPVSAGLWWFATTYFVLFLLHPFINRLLRALDKREYQRLLALLLVMWCVIPTFTTYTLKSNQLWEFVVLYCIGGYIRLYGRDVRLKSGQFALLWLCAAAVVYGSSVVFMLLGRKIAVFGEHPTFFYDRMSLPTLIQAVFFFMTFERLTMPNSKLINLIASATFGVYLIHDSNITRPWLWKTVFVNARYQNSNYLIPYSVMAVLIVYTVCTLIDLARSRTVEVVYMKAVDRVLNKVGKADRVGKADS